MNGMMTLTRLYDIVLYVRTLTATVVRVHAVINMLQKAEEQLKKKEIWSEMNHFRREIKSKLKRRLFSTNSNGSNLC